LILRKTFTVGYWVGLCLSFWIESAGADVVQVCGGDWSNGSQVYVSNGTAGYYLNVAGVKLTCPSGYVVTGTASGDSTSPQSYLGPTANNPTYGFSQQGCVICAKVCN
jgi:hypothetical protein